MSPALNVLFCTYVASLCTALCIFGGEPLYIQYIIFMYQFISLTLQFFFGTFKVPIQSELQNYRLNNYLEQTEKTICSCFRSPVGVTETLEERIATLEEVLLKDLKLMKHRQVIHPVLQEGKKLHLNFTNSQQIFYPHGGCTES